jgi:hypothetical protein
MAKHRQQRESGQAANSFQFTLAGLIIFSLALMGGTSFITWKLSQQGLARTEPYAVDTHDKSAIVRNGVWGTLLTRDIELERPAEYLTEEVATPRPEVWTFAGLRAAAVKNLLLKNGVSEAQAVEAFAPGNFVEKTSGTELKPSEKFLMSFTPEQRRKFYLALAGAGVNLYLDFPYIFPGTDFADICNNGQMKPEEVSLLKALAYPNGSATQLSDYDFLLEKIPTLERRTKVTQALSRQSAVLARLAVQPDTDIDKIASYWGNVPNVRFTDIRPLMESLKQLPEGGSMSLLYFLPKFARERLYTFPLPAQAGDPVMDCHWSTFNFFNETPDNRFNDPNFAVEYIRKNYYQIAAPSQYGDILLLMNEKQEVKHSAVFIADDIVFTKNGNNYRQPWMLMRISDLLATYPDNPPMKPIYMRRKTD